MALKSVTIRAKWHQKAQKKDLKKFMKKNLIDNLMITLSEKGILIITKQSVSKSEIYESEIVDVSGAGDAIISLASILFYLNLPHKFIGKICLSLIHI